MPLIIPDFDPLVRAEVSAAVDPGPGPTENSAATFSPSVATE